MAPVGAIFPAEKGVLGLLGKILPGGDIEYGYLIENRNGGFTWVNQQDAATIKREV
jgi:hypothetical protein